MNYRDVALLNNSLDGLGQTLLRNRMMDDQRQQQTRDTDLRERALEATLTNQKRDNSRQDEMLEITRGNAARSADDQVISRINGLYATFAKGVEGGYIDANMANAALKEALNKLPAEKRDSIMANTPLGIFTQSGGFKNKPASTARPEEIRIEGGRIITDGKRWQFVEDAAPKEPTLTRDPSGQETIRGTPRQIEAYDKRKQEKANPPPAAPGAMSVGGGITIGNPSGKQPQRVTTKQQFDALPSGAVYTGKDGRQYRKP